MQPNSQAGWFGHYPGRRLISNTADIGPSCLAGRPTAFYYRPGRARAYLTLVATLLCSQAFAASLEFMLPADGLHAE